MITNRPVNNHDDIQNAVDNMLDEIGLSRGDLDGKVTFAGLDPIMATTLKVGAAGAILGSVNSLASAIIWQMRSGEGQDIHADLRKTYAIQSAFNPGMEKYSMINGYSVLWDQDTAAFSGILPTKDSRFVFMCALYPRQRYHVLNLLRSGNSMDAMKQAARKWDAEDLEAAAMDIMVPIHNIRTYGVANADTEKFGWWEGGQFRASFMGYLGDNVGGRRKSRFSLQPLHAFSRTRSKVVSALLRPMVCEQAGPCEDRADRRQQRRRLCREHPRQRLR
jgi:hypothetical protein